jgi:hypothetical protein
MDDRARVVVKLILDSTADPISGRLVSAAGETEAFVGWLGLAGALERVLAVADRATESP